MNLDSLANLYKCTGRAIALPPPFALVEKCLSFSVMGKALSGKLSCMQTGLADTWCLT